MKTTLKEICGHRPCSDGFAQLVYSVTGRKESPEMNISEQFALLTEEEKNKQVSLITILESNGIEHAVWALRCFDYRDYCLFLADVAESVLHLFETEYPEDDRPRKAIQAIRDYHSGKINLKELKAVVDAAESAEVAASNVAWAAEHAAAGAAARAAEEVVAAAVEESVAESAVEAVAEAVEEVAEAAKWQEVESLFRKHFGGKDD